MFCTALSYYQNNLFEPVLTRIDVHNTSKLVKHVKSSWKYIKKLFVQKKYLLSGQVNTDQVRSSEVCLSKYVFGEADFAKHFKHMPHKTNYNFKIFELLF